MRPLKRVPSTLVPSCVPVPASASPSHCRFVPFGHLDVCGMFARRFHVLTKEDGWRDVLATALAWLDSHADADAAVEGEEKGQAAAAAAGEGDVAAECTAD